MCIPYIYPNRRYCATITSNYYVSGVTDCQNFFHSSVNIKTLNSLECFIKRVEFGHHLLNAVILLLSRGLRPKRTSRIGRERYNASSLITHGLLISTHNLQHITSSGDYSKQIERLNGSQFVE